MYFDNMYYSLPELDIKWILFVSICIIFSFYKFVQADGILDAKA